ncbi:MAG: DNA-directed polymerase subunit omega [Verrucomicrobiota bacterium]
MAPGEARRPNTLMNSYLLEEALKHVGSHQVLVNAVSKRVKQLNQGDRPMVDAGMRAGFADIALQEIIEGKLRLEVPPAEVAGVS